MSTLCFILLVLVAGSIRLPAAPPEAGGPARGGSDSLELEQLVKAMQPALREAQVRDIISKLPPKCKVFGFDIGDYSADSASDAVVSVRTDDQPRRSLTVCFFRDAGTSFELVRTMQKVYMNEPIEVGFSIDEGKCHVTQKLGEFHWDIRGYTIRDGVFRETEVWESGRLPAGGGYSNIGFETGDDYATLRGSELYYRAADLKTILRAEFFVLPVFPARVKRGADVAEWIGDSTFRAILRGSSSWFGADDCSVFARAAYDSATVTVTAVANDDRLLSFGESDTADYLLLCLDVLGNRKVETSGKLRSGDDGLIRITVRADTASGFIEPVHIETGKLPEEKARLAKRISCSVHRTPEGVVAECVFPRALFSIDEAHRRFRFSAAYHDVDNPDHPDWITIAATSDDFDTKRPETWGRMEFYPEERIPFEREDLRARALAARMDAAGIRH